jgi:hypothetical protein
VCNSELANACAPGIAAATAAERDERKKLLRSMSAFPWLIVVLKYCSGPDQGLPLLADGPGLPI